MLDTPTRQAVQYVAGQGGLRVGGDWYGLREGR
jgi:hypothetical protein